MIGALKQSPGHVDDTGGKAGCDWPFSPTPSLNPHLLEHLSGYSRGDAQRKAINIRVDANMAERRAADALASFLALPHDRSLRQRHAPVTC